LRFLRHLAQLPELITMKSLFLITLLLPESSTYLLTQMPARGALLGRDCRSSAPQCALFREEVMEEGAEWQGTVSKIVDYGCFVRLGTEQNMGLIHISSLTKERIEREQIPEFVEANVGPVGSKVKVELTSLKFKGTKRVSLKLLEVLSRDKLEDLAIERNPHRRARLRELEEERLGALDEEA